MMEHFTPVPALVGGILVGLSTSMLLVLNGKIAGISGIVGGLFRPAPGDTAWRATFVAGLFLGGLVLRWVYPAAFGESVAPLGTVALAGGLVGIGTRLGNGCTSGHGVCGNARLSARSMVATVTFIATGALSVFVARQLLGGAA